MKSLGAERGAHLASRHATRLTGRTRAADGAPRTNRTEFTLVPLLATGTDDLHVFDREPVSSDADRFAEVWNDVSHRTIALDDLGLTRVETVWSGSDPSRPERPGRFETTVTVLDTAIETRVYSTSVEALEGHERAVLTRRRATVLRVGSGAARG